MLRKNLNWDGTGSTVLYDPKTHEFYYYEAHVDAVHRNYGGQNYYQSQTGKTGAGYIENFTGLLTLGYYRPDVKHENAWYEHEYEFKGYKITIYIPVIPHSEKGFAWNYPVVVRLRESDEKKVFLHFQIYYQEPETVNDIINKAFAALNELNDDGNKIINIGFLNERYTDIRPDQFTITVLGGGWYGMDLLRFVHYQPFTINQPSDIVTWQSPSTVHYQADIIKAVSEDTRSQYGMYGWADSRRLLQWSGDKDPLFTRGENGLIDDFGGFWEPVIPQTPYNQKYIGKKCNWLACYGRDNVLVIAYCKRGNKIFEYEQNFSRLEFLTDTAAAMATTRKRLKEKIIKALYGERKLKRDKQALEKLDPNKIITINDSIAAGNCRLGTEQFRDRFFPGRESATVAELKPYLDYDGVRQVLLHIIR